jgi:hypothetical protein
MLNHLNNNIKSSRRAHRRLHETDAWESSTVRALLFLLFFLLGIVSINTKHFLA